jgi:dephospho-CoA kinase
MIILGLTGSIGMGKSTAGGMLRRMGIPVCDSDAIVHRLLGTGGAAVEPVGRAFEGVVRKGAVDRAALGQRVFTDPGALKRLEAIIHPLVFAAQEAFLKRMAARRERVVVLDVPLLFEVGSDALCDATIVVTAPRFLQDQRVLRRPGMTRARMEGALARQMPDHEKRRRADFVVQTGRGKRDTLNQLTDIVTLVQDWQPAKWPPRGRVRGADARNRT